MAILDTIKEAIGFPATLVAIALVAAVAIIGGLAWFGIFAALAHDPWFPEIIMAITAAIVLAAIVFGIPWYRERSFVHRLGSAHRVAGEQSPQEFQAKFTYALRRFRGLPQHSGKGEPLYSLPWFLMIGRAGSGKTEALKASGLFSALTPIPTEGGTHNCDWWVSNSMLMLDTAGRYAIPAEIAQDRAEWYRLLRLIRHYHAHEPLSGIIVTAAANDLASEPDEKLRADAGQIRERIEEVIQELGVELPVYLLATKCDLLEGFSEFFGVLPNRILDEAVGFVDDPPAGSVGATARDADALRRIQAGIHSVYERFSLLRSSILNDNTPENLRQPIFCFAEEFRAIERPLNLFIEPIIGEDVRYHTPLFRGLFLASARRDGKSISMMRRQVQIGSEPMLHETKTQTHYFLRDLFETILPRDRALASKMPSKQKSV